MAAPTTASSHTSFFLSLKTRTGNTPKFQHSKYRTKETGQIDHFQLLAARGSGGRQRASPGVDTRIHWPSEDDGWVGGDGGSGTVGRVKEDDELPGEKFSDLLNCSSDSYYRFLGISPMADLEEIKAAYTRLSKEYHPDTTVLPLKAASEKLKQLGEIYDVLSNGEKRRFYNWTLAREAAGKMRMVKPKDPYLLEIKNLESIPDMADGLRGRNMDLEDQAKQAITFDILVVIFSIWCIAHVHFFQEQY